jgi:tripartite-type tricarboxylate transporter receptor subunit TctC
MEGFTPEQDVRVIIPYGPGGGYDFYSRNLAATLQEHFLDVSVQVQNVEGGGGITGMNAIWNADNPDHTLGIMNTESHALGQITRDAAQYQMTEFTYYPRVAGTTRAVATFTNNDLTTFRDVIAGTVAGDVKWAHQGPQSTNAVQIKAMAVLGEITIDGEDFTLEDYENNAVQFGGRGEELTAAKRGDVQATAGSYSSLLDSFMSNGDARAVLTYTSEDSCPETTENPDCTTFETTDVDISNTSQINAISGGPFHRIYCGPPGTSDAASSFWCDTITQAMEHESFQQRAEEANRPIKYGDCELARQGAVGTYETYNQQQDLLRQLGLME